MTIKKLWKRICCLFHDDRTRLRNGESVEDWEEVQQKRREIEAEKQKEEDEILSTWFVRDEYINAGWFKRILLTLHFCFGIRTAKKATQTPKPSPATTKRRKKTTLVFGASMKFSARFIT